MEEEIKCTITPVFKEMIGTDIFVFDIIAIDEQKLFQGTKIGCAILNTKKKIGHYHGLKEQIVNISELMELCWKFVATMKETVF